jgi:hypothetical protein
LVQVGRHYRKHHVVREPGSTGVRQQRLGLARCRASAYRYAWAVQPSGTSNRGISPPPQPVPAVVWSPCFARPDVPQQSGSQGGPTTPVPRSGTCRCVWSRAQDHPPRCTRIAPGPPGQPGHLASAPPAVQVGHDRGTIDGRFTDREATYTA